MKIFALDEGGKYLTLLLKTSLMQQYPGLDDVLVSLCFLSSGDSAEDPSISVMTYLFKDKEDFDAVVLMLKEFGFRQVISLHKGI